MATIKEFVEKVNDKIDKYFKDERREYLLEQEIEDVMHFGEEHQDTRERAILATPTFMNFNEKFLKPATQQVIKIANAQDMYYFAKNVKYSDKGMIFDAMLNLKDMNIDIILQYIEDFQYWNGNNFAELLCSKIVNGDMDISKFSSEELIAIFDKIKILDIEEPIELISKLTTQDTISHIVKNLSSLSLSVQTICGYESNFRDLYIDYLLSYPDETDLDDYDFFGQRSETEPLDKLAKLIDIVTDYNNKVLIQDQFKTLAKWAISNGADCYDVLRLAYDCEMESTEIINMFIDMGNIEALMVNVFELDEFEIDDEHLRKWEDFLVLKGSADDISDFIVRMNYEEKDIKRVDLKKLNKALNNKVASGDDVFWIMDRICDDLENEGSDEYAKLLDMKGFIKALIKANKVDDLAQLISSYEISGLNFECDDKLLQEIGEVALNSGISYFITAYAKLDKDADIQALHKALLSIQSKQTNKEEIERVEKAISEFEQDHPEVLDQGLKQ